MNQTPKQIPTLPITDLQESVQKEIVMLNNIEKFLRRVRDISGDEAEYFVEAKKYIKAKVAEVYHKEVFRLQAIEALAKTEAPDETEEPTETEESK